MYNCYPQTSGGERSEATRLEEDEVNDHKTLLGVGGGGGLY